MYLNGEQIDALARALGKAFNLNRLDQLLLGRLDKSRADITLKDDYISILFDVVETANAEGWAIKLLSVARASNPNNPKLIEFEESLEIGVTPVADKPAFEKIVDGGTFFLRLLRRFCRPAGFVLFLWLTLLRLSIGLPDGLSPRLSAGLPRPFIP